MARDDTADAGTDQHGDPGRPPGRRDAGPLDTQARAETRPAKTSAAAAFALALGVTALLLVLTVVLSPVGLVVGILAIILGALGIRAARRPGITGKGVAITGLVLSVIAVLLAAAAAIGVTTFLTDESAVNRLEQQVEQLRDQLPSDLEAPQP